MSRRSGNVENNSSLLNGIFNMIDDPMLRSLLNSSNMGFGMTSSISPNTISSPIRSSTTLRFPIDMVNEEHTIYIYGELPGALKETINIDFYNNKLTITAEKNKVYENQEVSELKYGKYERVITLPICVTKREAISVSFKDGILKLKINKLIEEENKFSVKIEN